MRSRKMRDPDDQGCLPLGPGCATSGTAVVSGCTFPVAGWDVVEPPDRAPAFNVRTDRAVTPMTPFFVRLKFAFKTFFTILFRNHIPAEVTEMFRTAPAA